jgi:hypothetical protein
VFDLLLAIRRPAFLRCLLLPVRRGVGFLLAVAAVCRTGLIFRLLKGPPRSGFAAHGCGGFLTINFILKGQIMPHDARGNVIIGGDTLLARFKAVEVYAGEEACNVLVEMIRPEGCPEAEYAPQITCNTRLFSKEVPKGDQPAEMVSAADAPVETEPAQAAPAPAGPRLGIEVFIKKADRKGLVIAKWETLGGDTQYQVRYFDKNDCSNAVWFYADELTEAL